MLFAFVYTNNAISERNEAIMKFKKISIGACILALVLIAGATTRLPLLQLMIMAHILAGVTQF